MQYKKLDGVGIVGYGTYVPRLRIKVSEIASVHGVDSRNIEKNLGISEKSVADWDEDSVTMAYMAGKQAIEMADISAEKIGAIYVGSESHPYAVKPTSTIVAEALSIGNWYMAADLEFACKAATAGIQIVASHLISKVINYGLIIGADRALARPKDALEYTAAAGASAIVFGRRKILAKLEGFISYSSDTNDFWRRSGEKYPSHVGRFTGEPAYFAHVIESTKGYLKLSSTKPKDYDHVVFHMPNGKFPKKAAERLGFSEKQIEQGFIISEIGNPFSASSLMGLCRVLDKAKPQEKILVTSYGSGAGSDTFSFITTPELTKLRNKNKMPYALASRYLSYGEYRAMLDSN